MAKNNETPWWEPRTNTGNDKPPKSNFWRDLSQPWSYWRPTIQPPVYGYSYPFESAGMYDFNIPLGYNTPQTYTPDLPASNIGDPNFYLGTAPPAATATPVSAAPNVPPYNPQPNPYALGAGAGNVQQYAPKLSTGGSGSYGKPDYNYWYDMAQNQEQWTPEEQAAYLAQFYGQTDENGNLIGVGNPRWGDPYQVMPYWKYDQPTWIGIREGGASSMGRGRMPSRYYIPDQQVTRAGPNGPITAERPKPPPRRGETPNPEGNNIPAWVGPLVSWRT